MKPTNILIAAMVVWAAQSIHAAERSLFDGKDLTGWEGNTNVWRVQEGVIAGGHPQGIPRNEFLATTEDYRDFVFRLEYKIVAPGSYNSGIQFRSERIAKPANEMKGYQCDIGPGFAGAIYDESRRGRFLAPATTTPKLGDQIREIAKQLSGLEQRGEWNRCEIRCEGPRVQIFINGKQTANYTETDDKIPQSGKIALQVHGGNKQECRFRNITIEELNHEKK